MAATVTYTTFLGQIVHENRGGVERDYMPDTLGSTIALLDSSQNQTDTWSYWPYGEVATRTGTNVTPFTFVGTLGYFQDALTRLYVRARSLRVDLTRWMTVDPLWPQEPDFVYARCFPTQRTDPSGLLVEVCLRRVEPLKERTEYAHWWFNTDTCGAWGYGPTGIIKGWDANADKKKANCYRIPVTPSEQKCICDEARLLYAAGKFWKKGTGLFPDAAAGEYHRTSHNCQDYVQEILLYCTKRVLKWTEQGPTRCGPYMPSPVPACPGYEGD